MNNSIRGDLSTLSRRSQSLLCHYLKPSSSL
jgi:hypothetical protein